MKYSNLTDAEVRELKPTDTPKLRQIVKGLYENWYTHKDEPPTEEFYVRAVHKLSWFLRTGYVLPSADNPADCNTALGLFSMVTNHELEMSEKDFYASWSEKSALRAFDRRVSEGPHN